jgi:3-polyprenyl-4-hydroxybenzoate decarboxylase
MQVIAPNQTLMRWLKHRGARSISSAGKERREPLPAPR